MLPMTNFGFNLCILFYVFFKAGYYLLFSENDFSIVSQKLAEKRIMMKKMPLSDAYNFAFDLKVAYNLLSKIVPI